MFTSIIKSYPTPKGIKTAITWKSLFLDKYYVTTFQIPDAATLNVNSNENSSLKRVSLSLGTGQGFFSTDFWGLGG